MGFEVILFSYLYSSVLVFTYIYIYIHTHTHTHTFIYMYAYVSEKAMAPHSSTLAWKIPWTEEPGRLRSMGSLTVRHD